MGKGPIAGICYRLGLGRGRGRGLGRGIGMGRGFGMGAGYISEPVNQKQLLENRAEMLERELAALKSQLGRNDEVEK